MTARTPKPIVLVAVDGDVEPGTEFLVTPDEPVPIGRSARGITLLDRMVSIQHAVIHFNEARGYVIEDLGSATGTWVDEECIKGASRPIGVGTVLRFGDTVFEVARPARIMPWMRVVLAAAAAMAMVGTFATVVMPFLRDSKEGGIEASIQILGRTHDVLLPDYKFLREHGISMRHLAVLSDPKDYDSNGIQEVWLRVRSTGEDLLITFPKGSRDTSTWEILGKFPGNCVVQGDEEEAHGYFPLVKCQGTLWGYFRATEGLPAGYGLQEQDGVVVYYRTRSSNEPQQQATPDNGLQQLGQWLSGEGDIKVARLAVKSWDDLSAFFLKRGITDPVHYFMCESAFEGLPAQALLANGNVQRFSPGCHGEIQLEGEIRGEPVAIAVSPTGHQALVDDVITFYAGDKHGLFLPAKHKPIRDAVTAKPGFLQGGTNVRANPFHDRTMFYEPRPDRPVRPGPHPLESADNLLPAAPLAFTTTIVDEDMVFLDMPNCGRLKVWTGDFQNRGLQTMLAGTFSRVSEVSCTSNEVKLFGLDYPVVSPGLRSALVGDYEVRAMVDTEPAGRGVEVLRYRISYRKRPGPGMEP